MTQHGLDEQAIVDKWHAVAPLIDRMMERVGTKGEFPVGEHSSMAADDKASDPYQVSHVVRMCLTAGVDHLHAAKVLIVDSAVLHVAAPSSLARGALENFSAAYWVLGPVARNERIVRALRWHAKNAKDGEKATGPLNLPGAVSAEDKLQKLYVAGAKRNLAEKDIKRGLTSTEAVAYAEATAHDLPLGVVLPWQLCSGFAHGRPWAYLGASQLTEAPIPNSSVVNVRMTSSLGMALYPNLAALQLLERLLRLYENRAKAHLA